MEPQHPDSYCPYAPLNRRCYFQQRLGDFAFALDRFFRFTYVGPGIGAVLGYMPADVRGRLVTDFIPLRQIARLRRELTPVISQGSSFELVPVLVRHADGSLVRLRVAGRINADRLRDADMMVGFCTSIDVSDGVQSMGVSEDQLIALFRSISDALLIVNAYDYRVMEANPAAERLWGLSRRELIGRDAVGLVSLPDAMNTTDLLQHLRVQGTVFAEYPVTTAAGDTVVSDVLCALLPWNHRETILVTVRDASERHNDLLRDRLRTEALETLVNALPDTALRMDARGVIIGGHTINDGWINCADPVGSNVMDLLPDTEAEALLDRLGRVLATGQIEEWCFRLGNDHRPRYYEGRLIQAGPREALLMVRDITLQRMMEQRLQQVARAETVELLGTAQAIHDMRNMLTVVESGMSLLTCRSIQPQDMGTIDRMRRALDSVNQILGRLSDGTRCDNPRLKLVSANALLQDALRVSETPAATITHDIPPDMPNVRADSHLFGRVIQNLVKNAVEAGADRLHVIADVVIDAEHIGLSGRLGPYLRVRLVDNGPGMPPDVAAHVFDPFFTTREHGTGLGLSNVMTTLRNHHGAVELSSTEGAGATFTIYLPVTGAQDDPEPQTAAPDRLPQHVLVMEANEGVRAFIEGALTRQGIEVTCVPRGEDVVKLFLSGDQQPFDVMLLDQDTPLGLMNAVAVQRAVAASRAVPVILMSGRLEDDHVKRWREYGFAALLNKPFAVRELLSALARAFGDERQTSS